MADLAIGISKTAVEALVNKVKSALKEEAAKWQTLERDIVFIKDEFEMMQSFLGAASGERMKNQVARTWVRQVRDLSSDTEDCIEFVLHLDTKRSFWKRLLQSDMVQTMLPLDQAVAEIKQLKARAEDVNQRNLRYTVVSDHGEQMRQTAAPSQRTLDIIKQSADAFNNQEDTLDLARLIKTEYNGLQVISVWGTGGDFGTSSIIKQAYDDPEICKKFECRAWVKLVHPFNPHEFIRSLLAGFYTSSPRHEKEADEKSVHTDENSNTRWSLGKGISSSLALVKFAKVPVRNHQNLQKMIGQQEADIAVKVLETMEATQDSILTDFKETIKNKRYLIVLEDLSSIVQWNIIRTLMPDMKNRSRIVVSTQQHEIASLCMEQPNHEGLLRKFSPDHSVYALFKELPKRQQSNERKTCTKEVRLGIRPSKSEEHWQTEHHLFGRESELKRVEGQIGIAYRRRAGTVISVWGMAGVGKSFLVEAIYDHFAETFESSAVVSATHPFDIKHLCQDLVEDLKPEKGQDIFVRCWKHMEERWCLVVIDGLRSTEDWDLIESNLISGASRSCIIVITREESIARYCAKSDNAVCRIHGLEAEAARLLFEKVQQEKEKPDGNGSSRWDSSTTEEARLIIDKCGRLPKLIVALAKYLAEVPDPRREAQRLNANFMNALRTGSHELDSFREVFSSMYSSFLACSQLLKKCIFYLSIFTQSNIIRRSRLVRRWIAEGYSEGTDSNSMVEYTKNLIHKLANLSMILETKTPTMAGTGDMSSCQINSLFLQYVIEREKEENIFPPLEIFELKGKGSRNPPQRVGQHLTIASSWKRDKFVLDNMDFSRLRSLTVSREWRRFLVSDRMRVLRVLDLEDTNVNDDDIEQIMKRLPRLKFLSLRRCIKVTCLPGSLGDLRQLQTLDIKHTSVSTLPKSINKLQKLQYIRASAMVALMDEEPTPLRSSHGHDDACAGITVPRGIGALMCLHTLDVVNISATGAKTILKELKNLTQLNKLGVSGINRSNVKGFFSAIEGHSHLQSLSLQLHKDNNLEWLSKTISLPGNLQRLKMYVHVVKYPNWSCLQVLGQIRRLQTLRLRFETDEDVALQFSDSRDTPGQFGEIEVLEIACSSNLDVKFTRTEMALLKMLKVHCLNGSSLQFSGIENLKSLKHVWIKGSFDDIVKEELRRKVGQHQMKPELLILD